MYSSLLLFHCVVKHGCDCAKQTVFNYYFEGGSSWHHRHPVDAHGVGYRRAEAASDSHTAHYNYIHRSSASSIKSTSEQTSRLCSAPGLSVIVNIN